MYDIRWIRDNAAAFDEGRRKRGLEPLSEKLIALDEARREAVAKAQAAQERRNAASKEIGAAMKAGDKDKAETLKAEVAELKNSMGALEAEEKTTTADLREALSEIPNCPLPDVPAGEDENNNVEVRQHGEKTEFDFTPKEHFELGEKLGEMDFETAAKLSGSRFVVLKGGLARLERALMQFMLDLHIEQHGYLEVDPPLLVRDDAMFGTAQLPKFRDDQFAAHSGSNETGEQKDIEHHWLIPTAEVPLTNLVREGIVDEDMLPMRLTAGTSCFRAEAGAAGRDTRGMIRQHQFHKVELVSITTPEQALEEHERMTRCAEEVLKRLGLHYRVMLLCSGDMGFAAQKTYDLEVWLPGQGRYREVSSCSVCGDFQARRMNARYRTEKGPRFVHTLNGSGVAVGRALVAVLENYQDENGNITIPEALRTYMGGKEKIAAAGSNAQK